MLERIDHIDVRVPSLSEAEHFLLGLGFEVRRRHDGERSSVEMALPGDGQVFFEIREDTTLESSIVDHIAFAAGDVSDTVTVLQNAGYPAKEPRLVPSTGRTVSSFATPLGFKWQLTDRSK
ncbi:VOC family protein [Arthrobacter nitrophenolicus]|uniref:VOC family protein n=1 Tax=Arthrobacter nitrophenolicus TaxID=683150 RepID=UPI0026D4D0AA